MLKKESFFSSIKHYFDASYAGRYEAIILQEVSQECPSIMKILYNDFSLSKHTIVREYSYRNDVKKSKNRRADLAIFEGEVHPCNLRCLIEIKKEDKPLKGQLEDYINFSKENKIKFVYLTQHNPSKVDFKLIRKGKFCRHILFCDLYNQIKKKSSALKNACGILYLKYLEENGNMFTEINSTGVEKFLTRMFLPWGGNGRIRKTKDMIDTIPATFKSLMNNLYLINEEIGKKIECQMTIDYSVRPYVKKISNTNYDEDNVCRDTGNLKCGGEIWLYSSGSLSENKSVVVEFGLFLVTDSKSKPKHSYRLYAGVYLKGDAIEKGYEDKAISVKQMSDKNFCVKKLSLMLKNVLKAGLQDKNVEHVKKKIKNSLKNLN